MGYSTLVSPARDTPSSCTPRTVNIQYDIIYTSISVSVSITYELTGAGGGVVPRKQLRETKAFRALVYGLEEVRAQFIIGLVDGQVKLIEAGMRRWQAVCRAIVTMDLELLDSVHSFKSGETLQRHFGRTGHELEELGAIRLIKGAQSTPEPLYL